MAGEEAGEVGMTGQCTDSSAILSDCRLKGQRISRLEWPGFGDGEGASMDPSFVYKWCWKQSSDSMWTSGSDSVRAEKIWRIWKVWFLWKGWQVSILRVWAHCEKSVRDSLWFTLQEFMLLVIHYFYCSSETVFLGVSAWIAHCPPTPPPPCVEVLIPPGPQNVTMLGGRPLKG